jgi:DNA polymerase I
MVICYHDCGNFLRQSMKKFVIIDGNALIHRGFHAIPNMTTSKGEVVNGVFGFTSMLVNIIAKERPEYIAVAFDMKGPTIRHEQYKEYKATRVKAPDALYEQIPKIKEVCAAFNIPMFGIAGYEADDILGTMAETLKKDGDILVEIVTGDMDTLQLVDDNVLVLAPSKGFSETKIYDKDAVKEKYGLNVEQFVDYKALRGDPSDNIPGVKGIGEKTAVKLLQEFGTLDEIYKNIEKIKGKLKEVLEKGKESAYLSRRLSEIIKNIKIDFNMPDCKLKDFDQLKVRGILEDLEFHSIVRRLEKIGILQVKIKEDPKQMCLF